jgi:hypothetical protein
MATYQRVRAPLADHPGGAGRLRRERDLDARARCHEGRRTDDSSGSADHSGGIRSGDHRTGGGNHRARSGNDCPGGEHNRQQHDRFRQHDSIGHDRSRLNNGERRP